MDDVDDDDTSSDGEDGSDRPSALDTLVQGLVPCLGPQGVLLLMELDYRGRLHSDALAAWARDNATDLGRRGVTFHLVTAGAGPQTGGVDAGLAALAALRCAARRCLGRRVGLELQVPAMQCMSGGCWRPQALGMWQRALPLEKGACSSVTITGSCSPPNCLLSLQQTSVVSADKASHTAELLRQL